MKVTIVHAVKHKLCNFPSPRKSTGLKLHENRLTRFVRPFPCFQQNVNITSVLNLKLSETRLSSLAKAVRQKYANMQARLYQHASPQLTSPLAAAWFP